MKHRDIVIFFLIFIIMFSIFYFQNWLSFSKISIASFLAGFGGIGTLYLFYLRDKHMQKQIDQTNIQISNQELTRKDQQFLEAIKLIEEKKDSPRLGGLHILENLAKTDRNYRQRILEYLGTHTIKLKKIVESVEFIHTSEFPASTFNFELGFEKISINIVEKDGKNYLVKGNNEDFIEIVENKLIFGKYLDYELTINDEFLNYHEGNIGTEEEPDIEQFPYYEFNITVKSIKKENHQLKLNFFNKIKKENFFEYECFKLAEKIINYKEEYYLNLDLSDLYFPFISIDSENKLIIKTKNMFYEDNLTGIRFSSNKNKKNYLKIDLVYIPKFSTFINTGFNFKKYYYVEKKLKALFIENEKVEMYSSRLLLTENFTNSKFETVNFYLINETNITFNNCLFQGKSSFYLSKFYKKGDISLKFDSCEFNEIRFEDKVEVETINFENCNYYLEVDLSNVLINCDDRVMINKMKKEFEEIKNKVNSFKEPTFKN